jgi:ribosomal protein S18 acetylase RimI-like enzyme
MIEIRPMTATDLPLGLRLCRQAGWNQIESDWRRFLSMQPQGCFVAELDRVPVATTVTCLFGPVAWIAMVLVEVMARRKGVATSLLKHALEFLDNQGVESVRLDATAAGQPVYEKLGFTPEYRLTRYEGTAPPADAQSPTVAATMGLFPQIVEFDRRMTGTHREKMLVRLFEESPGDMRVLCRGDQLEGFITVRRGANATQIGPCVATSDAGPRLLGDVLARWSGRRVFIDVPRDNPAALRLVEASGLTTQRQFMRMCRGKRVADHPQAIWASSGPEKG